MFEQHYFNKEGNFFFFSFPLEGWAVEGYFSGLSTMVENQNLQNFHATRLVLPIAFQRRYKRIQFTL